MKPSDFKPMHNGERFQVRQVSIMAGRSEWQVYAEGLQHIASCCRAEIAGMIAKCLNEATEEPCDKLPTLTEMRGILKDCEGMSSTEFLKMIRDEWNNE